MVIFHCYVSSPEGRWWFHFLLFTPIWGRWTHFDEHIFQMGWNLPSPETNQQKPWNSIVGRWNRSETVCFGEGHSWATKDDQFPIVTQVREVTFLELKIGVPKISILSKEMLSLSHHFSVSICNFYRCNRSAIFSRPKRCFGLWYSESRTLKKSIWEFPQMVVPPNHPF